MTTLLNLPSDLVYYTILKLDYYWLFMVAKLAKSCNTMHKILLDDKFWKLYATGHTIVLKPNKSCLSSVKRRHYFEYWNWETGQFDDFCVEEDNKLLSRSCTPRQPKLAFFPLSPKYSHFKICVREPGTWFEIGVCEEFTDDPESCTWVNERTDGYSLVVEFRSGTLRIKGTNMGRLGQLIDYDILFGDTIKVEMDYDRYCIIFTINGEQYKVVDYSNIGQKTVYPCANISKNTVVSFV